MQSMNKKRFNLFLSSLLTLALLLPMTWTGAPVQAESADILYQNFEDQKTGGWENLSWSGEGKVVVSSAQASEGQYSLHYKDRSSRKSSLSLDLTNVMKSNHVYDISFKLRSEQGEDTYHLGSKVKADGKDTYPWIIGGQKITDQAWTKFEKKGYVVPANTTEFRIWIESHVEGDNSDAKAGIYLDEFLIKDVTPNNGTPSDPSQAFTTVTFEDGKLGPVVGRAGSEKLTVTDRANHTAGGGKALKVEGRSDTWHGPTISVEKYVEVGKEYEVSAWVKLIEPASTTLRLSTQVGQGSGASYNSITSATASVNDGWVKLQGTHRYNSNGDGHLTIYVEAPDSKTASFYIDDISFVGTGTSALDIQKDLTPMKEVYQQQFLIGNAISGEDLVGRRLDLLKMHHNVATTGNAMKPDALQKVKGTFTFNSADAMVNKVLAEGMQMHGHVLVWHQQSPSWMYSKMSNGVEVPLSREEALGNMQTHIRTVMEHFGDRVISWDVVNEAMSDNPSNPTNWKNALRKSMWYNAIGSDFVEQAFLAAREVLEEHPQWDVKLYYNDYNEDNQNKATAIASMVKELNDKYAVNHPGKKLIDGIGMQGHYNLNTNPTNVKLSLERFINTGVEVSVTELDIQAGSNYTLRDKEANAQGYLYAQLMDLYKKNSQHIARVTIWGMDDGTSWRPANNPLIFDKNLQAKPAYYAFVNPLKFIEEYAPDTTEANESTAIYGTPVIDGKIDTIWQQAPAMQVNRYQMAWQGASGVAKALWDDNNLYVLVQVSDRELDKSSPNSWEQDSVEVFLDQNNGKTTFYQEDDGQYRVNFENMTSFNPDRIKTGVETKVTVSGTNYIVEMKIPFTAIKPSNNMKIGFDVQINDAKAGARQSVAAWNDIIGNGYQDTSVFGTLILTGKPAGK